MEWAVLFFMMSVIIFLIVLNHLIYVGKEHSHPKGEPATHYYRFPWEGVIISLILVFLTFLVLAELLDSAG